MHLDVGLMVRAAKIMIWNIYHPAAQSWPFELPRYDVLLLQSLELLTLWTKNASLNARLIALEELHLSSYGTDIPSELFQLQEHMSEWHPGSLAGWLHQAPSGRSMDETGFNLLPTPKNQSRPNDHLHPDSQQWGLSPTKQWRHPSGLKKTAEEPQTIQTKHHSRTECSSVFLHICWIQLTIFWRKVPATWGTSLLLSALITREG